MKANLTKRFVEKLAPPPRGRLYVNDEATPGLQLVVTPTGHRSFYSYRKISGRPERVLLGSFPDLTIEQARKAAAVVNGQIAKGENPQERRRKMRGTSTFEVLFQRYMERHAKARKRSWKEDQGQFDRYLKSWSDRKLYEIKRGDVQAMHRHVGNEHGRYASNRVLALVRKVFNYAITEEDYERSNPAQKIEKFPEEKRDRFLQGDELPRFFRALDADPDETFRDFVKLSLMTGARRRNVEAMRWDQLDLDHGLWRIPQSKSGEPIVVPLPAEAIEILENRKSTANGSPWVLPSRHRRDGHYTEPKRSWKNLLERAGIENLRVHDLRRSLGSWMSIGGTSMTIVSKALGHKSMAATAVYARLSVDPVRIAVQQATAAMLLAGKESFDPNANERSNSND